MHHFDQGDRGPEDIKSLSSVSGRKGSKKVRSGCITCKIRKVKCDEAKPYCMRCTKTGRKCDGYLDDAALAIRQRRRRRPAVSSLADSLTSAHQAAAGRTSAMATTSGSISSPATPPLSATLVSRLPGLLSWESAQEKRSFEFFQHITAPSLAGDLDAVFWRVLVLQICHTEPAVRHAVLAISSLHEAFLQVSSGASVETAASSPALPSCKTGTAQKHEFALQQYNKAIARLLEDMKMGGDRESGNDSSKVNVKSCNGLALRRPVAPLMTCVLFVCIEVMQGKDKEALIHLEQGRHILSQLDSSRPPTTADGGATPSSTATRPTPTTRDTDPEMAVVRQHLVPLYTRLSMTSFLFGGSPEPIPSSLKTINADRIPNTFDSIHALRAAIHDFLDAVLRFTQRARPTKYQTTAVPRQPTSLSSYTSSRSSSSPVSIQSPPPSAPADDHKQPPPRTNVALYELEADKQALSAQLGRLRVAISLFRVNQSAMATTMASPNAAAMVLLQIHLCIAEIWLATALTRAETAYDAHVETFSTVVALAATALDAEQQQQQQKHQQQKQQQQQHQQATDPVSSNSVFTFETHVIPALYYVATKCRHGLVRHAALALLTRNGGRRENLWRADVLGAIASRIIKLEEGHAAVGIGKAKRKGGGAWPNAVKEEEKQRTAFKSTDPAHDHIAGSPEEYHGYQSPSASPNEDEMPLDLGLHLLATLPEADPFFSEVATMAPAVATTMDNLYAAPMPTVLGQWDYGQHPSQGSAVPWIIPTSAESEIGAFSAYSAADEEGETWDGEDNFLMDNFFFFGEARAERQEGWPGSGDEKKGGVEVQVHGLPALPALRLSRPTPAGSAVEPQVKQSASSPSSSFSSSSESGSPVATPTPGLPSNQESTEAPFNISEYARVHTAVIGPEEAKGRWVTLFRKPQGLEGAWDVQAEFVRAAV